MEEIWKEIKDFSEYQVSNFGRIKSLKFGKEKFLKPSRGKNNIGYFHVILCKNKKQITKNIHVLVYETFYNDELKQNECIHHKDENKENNYYNNLIKVNISFHQSCHNKGKHLSKETRNKISKLTFGNKNHFFGKRHSQESKEKMSTSHYNYYRLKK